MRRAFTVNSVGPEDQMSFAQEVKAEIQHLGPVFAAAEKADKEFHQAWKEGLAKVGAGQYKQTDRYRDTLERFHAATRIIDEIVLTAFVQARLGDLAQLPSLFAYIALPGRYFRSGYQRAGIWRFLKKLPLDEEQSGVLRGIVLRQIETAGPEFREISQIVSIIDSADLRESVNTLGLRSEKEYVRRRVERVLGRMGPLLGDGSPKP
jgi:hypothetical protein